MANGVEDSNALVIKGRKDPEAPPHPYSEQLGAFVEIFQGFDAAFLDLYAAQSFDTNDVPTASNARQFREAVQAQNPIPVAQPPSQPPDKVSEGKQPSNQLGVTLKNLSLRSLRLGTAAASCLALHFRGREITRLDLSDNQLSNSSAAAICGIIHGFPRLKCLILSGNLLTAACSHEIGKELELDQKLEELILGEPRDGSSFTSPPAAQKALRPNLLGEAGLRVLLKSLSSNPMRALTSLVLCRTGLSAEAGSHLANFMEKDTLLTHLDVSCNPLSSEGICALLPMCTRLRLLDISDTGCRGEWIHSRLCSLLQEAPDLGHLSLAYNALETRPLRRMCRSLVTSTSLSSLNLAGTWMDADGVTALADALVHSKVHNVTDLDLSDNQFSEVEAVTALAHTIVGTGLRVLRLNRNALGDACISELADALNPQVCPPTGPALQQLELASCQIGLSGAKYLLQCIQHNETLMCLKLSDNYLDDSLDITLVESIEFLQDLRLDSNRLSRRFLSRAAQMCARNVQIMRDQVPRSLRKEVHRLLEQETKLEEARKKVGQDEAEIFVRISATSNLAEELRELRWSIRKATKQHDHRINSMEDALSSRRQYLERLKETISEFAHKTEVDVGDLKDKLRKREKEMAEHQVQSDNIEKHLAQRQEEHPREVQDLRSKIEAALANTEQLRATGDEMRAQLLSLQQKSLIDFKP
eukprot:TRINITY_DN42758_c0_g1_i1.p1 TRINITY_DN42758_c0_g1~~TRINITY_DN42758_c0_g1_i1.p1  ORF type:complete len:701 (-),score=135.34 TRINITY_DN42758_c0_g1_i1:47-2149(-)